MLDKIKQSVFNSRLLQYLLVSVVSAGLAILLYPTKHIEEREHSKYEQELKTLNEQHLKEKQSLRHVIDTTNKKLTQVKSQYESKFSKLTSEIKDLKSNQKTSYYKIIRPDGTIEIKKFSESEVTESTRIVSQIQEEFKSKVDSIEKRWQKTHEERVAILQKEFDQKQQQYKKELAELEKTKITDINKKNFGLEIGASLDATKYVHVTYDILGSLFLGLNAEVSSDEKTGGAGIGIRF